MTPERIARLVARWVRVYTRGLPTPIARRRIEEIDADLQAHIAHERARGTGDRRLALGILSRMVRGVTADASWRGESTRATGARRLGSRPALATALILLVPLAATQLSEGMAWTAADFAVAAALLFGAGLAYELVARRAGNLTYRLAAAMAVGTGLMLLWTIGAVGVIGEDGDPADLMYLGVLAVGIAGAVSARLRPHGMARALVAMAVAQGLVAVIALIAGKHEAAFSSVAEILGVNAFFAALFVSSAWLFRRAGAIRD